MRFIIAKKGVSEIVSYVLLIVMVVSLASLVYVWAKARIPIFEDKCPEGLSMIITECFFEYSNNAMELNITFRNNGNFNITGAFVYLSFYDETIINLTDFPVNLRKTESGQTLDYDFLPIDTEKEYITLFNLPPGKNLEDIKEIEVIPVKRMNNTVLCSKIKYPFKEGCKNF